MTEEFSQSIAIVYPARYDGAHASAHCTAIYLGEIPDVTYCQDQVMAAVWDIRHYWGNHLRDIEVLGADWFGVDNDVPVMILEPQLLKIMRHLIDVRLGEDCIKSGSQFPYRPHVTVKSDLRQAPDLVTLESPVLWWGADRQVNK